MQTMNLTPALRPRVMLTADCSSSLTPCFDKLRSALKNAYLSLCEACDVGVGVYAEKFQLITSPAPFSEKTLETLGSLEPAFKSNLSEALYCAADCFELSSAGEKHVFLFTDGGFDGGDPFLAAKELSEAGIKLHAIGFSGNGGCLSEELGRLTGGHFAHSYDAAAYVDSVFPSRFHKTDSECVTEEVCTCGKEDVNIRAELPCPEGFCTVNVALDGGCSRKSSLALCVRLMLGGKPLSEKYVCIPKGEDIPTSVSFIVPESVFANGHRADDLCAYVSGNPLYL